MRDRKPFGSLSWAVLLFFTAIFGFNACSDVDNVSRPPAPAQPGPLAILTSSPLPAGTAQADYNVTLAPNGGTPPYTWSLATGSPLLPDGLALTPSTGKILGVPTTPTATRLTEFKLQDSTGKSVQKVLAITVNIAPTPLAILTNSLPNGSINQLYAFALSPTGGTTPYTWDLKTNSPPLPSGLTLSNNGVISGTPTVTSNDTHTFTLTDATSLTIEKPLQLSINAIPLSITTNSPLPQGTANQNYSTTLTATGGTGTRTWRLASGSPDLPSGLTLDLSTGEISGIPTGTSNNNYTFTVTDETPPTPQTVSKTLQLIIGAAPPTLTITTTNPLPPGTVFQSYNFTLAASGGTGAKTWDLVGGSLPAGFNPLSSSGVISGTPTSAGTTSATFRVRDSGNPQQSVQKQLSITINLPAAPSIQTTSLPSGSFNQAYNQTLGVTGGIPPLIWGVIAGGLPTGLTLNSSNGKISGIATATGKFDFTVEVTDAIPQSDTQALSITITAPPAPSITTSSLPIGTVNIPYSAQLQAINGAPPLNFQPVGLPFGLTFNVTPDSSTATITGTPTSDGSQNITFTVNDSNVPCCQTGTRILSLAVNAALTIDTTSPLPAGTVGQPYAPVQLVASGGAPPYTWSITGTGQPDQAAPGLTLSLGGVIGGSGQTPTTADSFTRTYRVEDSNGAPFTKSLTLNVNAALTIDDTSLPAGQVNVDYGLVTLTASGGTPPYTWSTTVTPPLPAGLSIDAAGTISGTPTVDETNIDHTFTVTDSASTPANVTKALSLTIDPP